MLKCHVISRHVKKRVFKLFHNSTTSNWPKSMAGLEASTSPEGKKKQFGNRHLTDPKNVFEHNAWDHVVWDEEQEKEARLKADEQLRNPASKEDQERFEAEADQRWDKFYNIHENKFFKDRQWLFTEFPELAPEYYQPQKKPGQTGTENPGTGAKDSSCDIGTDGTNQSDNNSKDSQLVASNVSDNSPISVTNDTSDLTCRLGDVGISSGITPASVDLGSLSTDGSEQIATDKSVDNSTEDAVKCSENFPGEAAHYRIFEVGCGVGNTVFPILQTNNDPKLMVYCCDFSSTAIDLVKQNKDYPGGRCHSFVCDVSDPAAVLPFPDGSLDIIILIFVLSAINPDRHQAVLNRLARLLRPGGTILFRDYGRYDMAQLRFKKGRCLGENFYARGDGTRVYFFTQDDLRAMMTNAGLAEKQNLVDRRLQVNRGRQLKMYRVWIQCKYVKPKTEQT